VRFFDEFLRGDEIRGFIFGLSTSQFISIFVEIFALGMLLIIPRINKKKAENDEASS
jgi:phosphatidylglycerol:prolipoprotein diacylglycerol transferase